MSLALLMKTPGDVLDYDVSFDEWLTGDDRINEWNATVADSSAVIDRGDYTDRSVRLWISGGGNGETAQISLTVTTAQGRTKVVCFKLRIKECR
ncbi:hypothetical protein ELZ19_09550 [Brucella abortus]|uniref:phage fiber-tail adaptor protein n=1 Tax=Brucella abortus TaxID=235 RepID=UPI0004E860D6|nr:hypothetical protein [Brucella abortus]KFH18566.1 hypothetical protein IB60_16360 [Brucella abortus LMN1]KFH24269.1 hypothetical protein IB61_11415 [Brucella abortus LMN2]RUQ67028.1 hypothetical protein ELZ23_15765 [Brucella abortus]RUQ78331.1 hypothetical protein ELZ22_17225 [Brucella abortus]RUQ88134.1 hypothetical protein ELZ18_15850 [Brucella abortus]